jgi:hypothetical protein
LLLFCLLPFLDGAVIDASISGVVLGSGSAPTAVGGKVIASALGITAVLLFVVLFCSATGAVDTATDFLLLVLLSDLLNFIFFPPSFFWQEQHQR